MFQIKGNHQTLATRLVWRVNTVITSLSRSMNLFLFQHSISQILLCWVPLFNLVSTNHTKTKQPMGRSEFWWSNSSVGRYFFLVEWRSSLFTEIEKIFFIIRSSVSSHYIFTKSAWLLKTYLGLFFKKKTTIKIFFIRFLNIQLIKLEQLYPEIQKVWNQYCIVVKQSSHLP